MLYIYNGIVPNRDYEFYYFASISRYLNELESHLIKTETLDNYRINTNIVKLKIDNVLTERIADTITYLIDTREANNDIIYFRAYHVNKITIQSGYVILNCTIDMRASYFFKSEIKNLNVLRCNRNIGVGLLDNIKGTRGTLEQKYCAINNYSSGDNNELYARNKTYAVFALKYNNAQNNAGSVSVIKLFAVNLTEIVTGLYDANALDQSNRPYYSLVNPVELAIDFLGGIYGVIGQNLRGIQGTLNATIIGAWITDNVIVVPQDNLQIKVKTAWHNFTDFTYKPDEVVRAVSTRTLTFNNDFNKQFYLGTLQNGLKIQRTTEDTITCTLRTIASNDKLTFILSQGDNQVDVTDAFAVTIGTTDGDITTATQVLGVLQNSLKAIGNALTISKGVASGGGNVALALGIQNMASDTASEFARNSHVGGIVKGGDGAIAYYRVFTGQDLTSPTNNLNTPITNPYIINSYVSVNDESANVRLFGASFNEITTFTNIFNSALLGRGSMTYTYVKATCNISNIPSDAIDYITSKLSSGIYLINLT